MATYGRLLKGLAAALAVSVATLTAGRAEAQSIIKRPGAHPKYSFEAEPHLVIRDRHGHGDEGVGPGFRGTVVIVDNGFISSINNSVGIGFGADWLVLGDDDHCHGRFGCHDHGNEFVIPIVMQWNFWLHRKWSVFGEPGMNIIFNDHGDNDDDIDFDWFTLYGGGRFHFSDSAALTMRIGFPATFSIGVSFLL